MGYKTINARPKTARLLRALAVVRGLSVVELLEEMTEAEVERAPAADRAMVVRLAENRPDQ